jgi:hypothetical protein
MRAAITFIVAATCLAACGRDHRSAVLPEGTQLVVELQRGVRSDQVAPGDEVLALTIEDVLLGESVLVPTGTRIRGVVTSATPASSGDPASLAIEFRHLERDGRATVTIATLPIRLVAHRSDSSSGRVVAAGTRVEAPVSGAPLLNGAEDIALKPGQRILFRLDRAAHLDVRA